MLPDRDETLGLPAERCGRALSAPGAPGRRRPAVSATAGAPILEMRGISKTFPGVKALSDVSLQIFPGEVHALMGENGAGKSTLMKILSGAYQADPGGEIRLDGQPVVIDGPLAAKRLGVAIIYQELSLSPNLTVAENMLLGREHARGGFVDRRSMEEACRPVLERLGVGFRPDTLVSTLSMAERQLVEIARALVAQSRILVMDEPTTSLSSRETERLFALVRQFRAEGLAIVYISHRMAEVYELSDRCTVLRDGTYAGTLMREELSAERLVRMMVGRDLSSFYKKDHDAHGSRGRVILSVRDMADGRRVRGCSFDLHEGEVLGIAGLVGAGRTELARLIYAADPKTSGSVTLDGKPLVLILDEPTRGVDIGAKSEIYRLIDELARLGVGVVVISSELPEIVGTCDRVLVMREGRIAGEVGGAGQPPITQEGIIAIATGAGERQAA